MPRFIVPPKYVYSQETGSQVIAYPGYQTDTGSNGMFNYQIMWGDTSAWDKYFLCAPTPTLPSIGNGHDKRTHNKITVTSLRWKVTLNLTASIISRGQFLDGDHATTTFPCSASYQYPPNPNQFYKFRYMMVEFDEDLPISPPMIFNWFYSTFCFYRQATVNPVTYLANESSRSTLANMIPGPISVHSNIMRITTPWVGKFKILADKCFTITSNRPRVTIDLTIPINRVYTWNDETSSMDQSTALISPHIYCFILPPLSFEQDVGTYDTYAFNQYRLTSGKISTYQGLLSWNSWMKLNFVDI